jgi:cystine transport system ATP-binding protein
MVVVTHEIRFARSIADQVLFMDGGVVVESGPPEVVLSDPQQPRTRTFLHRVLDHIQASGPERPAPSHRLGIARGRRC